jgi:hypothetical protein
MSGAPWQEADRDAGHDQQRRRRYPDAAGERGDNAGEYHQKENGLDATHAFSQPVTDADQSSRRARHIR